MASAGVGVVGAELDVVGLVALAVAIARVAVHHGLPVLGDSTVRERRVPVAEGRDAVDEGKPVKDARRPAVGKECHGDPKRQGVEEVEPPFVRCEVAVVPAGRASA